VENGFSRASGWRLSFQPFEVIDGVFDCRKVNSWNSLSLFSHVWQQHGKLVNGNLIPVNTENTTLTKESVFLLIRTGKHFPFLSLHTFFSNSQITVSLFSSTIRKQQQVHHFS
jgi:hypothetical protein